MKKIAIVTNHLTPYRRFFYDKLYQKCRDKGYSFNVFLMTKCEPKRNWDYESLKTEYSHLMKDFHITFPINNHINLGVKKELKQLKPDIVIMAGSYMYITNWIVCKLKKKLRFKLLYWNEAHFNEIRNYNKLIIKIRNYIRKIFFKKIDGFWFSGQMSLNFCKRYSFGLKDYFFLPNLVDNEIYSKPYNINKQKRIELCNKWNIKKKVILIPARLSKEKAIDKFLYLVKKCKGIGKYTILVPGTGDYKPIIEQAIEKTRLDVRLLGFQQQNEMSELFSIADILVLPSLSDPNPLTCLEALWGGIHLILSKHVGNYPEVIDNNGCVFDYEDEKKSIIMIEEVLLADDKWFENAKLKSREIAKKIFEPNQATERVLNEMSYKYFS